MNCGVKFCGGCNPRYQRGEALSKIKERFLNRIDFQVAKEGVSYDLLLVIGGCTNNCASFAEYRFKLGCIKMWDESHINKIIDELETMYEEWKGEVDSIELDG